MDSNIWGRLPLDLVYKICNMCVFLKPRLGFLDEIKMYRLDREYYNYMSLFGCRNAWVYMFDDIHVYMSRNKIRASTVDESDAAGTFEDVCRRVWLNLDADHRLKVFEIEY